MWAAGADSPKNFRRRAHSTSVGEEFATGVATEPIYPLHFLKSTKHAKQSVFMNRILAAIARLGVAAGLLSLAGCAKSPPTASEAGAAPAAAQSAPIVVRESWDVYLLQGTRIGYGHTVERRDVEAGQPVVCTEGLNHLAVKRAGQTTTEDIRAKSIETPQGKLIRFESEVRMGPSPICTVGRVRGDRLVLDVTA